MHSFDQRTAEWFAARAGKATASKIADIMATTKSGYAASRANYAAQLICERLTGEVEPAFCSPAMAWGTEKEPEAREAYRIYNLCEVTEIGFVDHPTIPMSGASPDGLVGDDGLVEIKAPNTATHIETLRTGAVPGKYVKQMLWQMACTGRRWCDFASYDPRMPDEMRLIVIRLHRCDETIAAMEAEVSKFLAEVDEAVAELRAKYQQQKELAA